MRAKGELLLAHAPILTLGCTLVSTLSLMTLATATVLSIGSPTRTLESPTSEESISGKNESLELLVVLAEEELHLKVTGKNTTEVVQSLNKILAKAAGIDFHEKFFLSTPPQGV